MARRGGFYYKTGDQTRSMGTSRPQAYLYVRLLISVGTLLVSRRLPRRTLVRRSALPPSRLRLSPAVVTIDAAPWFTEYHTGQLCVLVIKQHRMLSSALYTRKPLGRYIPLGCCGGLF